MDVVLDVITVHTSVCQALALFSATRRAVASPRHCDDVLRGRCSPALAAASGANVRQALALVPATRRAAASPRCRTVVLKAHRHRRATTPVWWRRCPWPPYHRDVVPPYTADGAHQHQPGGGMALEPPATPPPHLGVAPPSYSQYKAAVYLGQRKVYARVCTCPHVHLTRCTHVSRALHLPRIMTHTCLASHACLRVSHVSHVSFQCPSGSECIHPKTQRGIQGGIPFLRVSARGHTTVQIRGRCEGPVPESPD